MIIYYKEQEVDSCFDCNNCKTAGHLNPVIACKAQNRAIGSYGSLSSIINLTHNVHKQCPFRNFEKNRLIRR